MQSSGEASSQAPCTLSPSLLWAVSADAPAPPAGSVQGRGQGETKGDGPAGVRALTCTQPIAETRAGGGGEEKGGEG